MHIYIYKSIYIYIRTHTHFMKLMEFSSVVYILSLIVMLLYNLTVAMLEPSSGFNGLDTCRFHSSSLRLQGQSKKKLLMAVVLVKLLVMCSACVSLL